MKLLYSNYTYDKFPPDDYFNNITKIFVIFNGSYFLTDRKLEHQVWMKWYDPIWWDGNDIQPNVGKFERHYILESDIPNNYIQLL